MGVFKKSNLPLIAFWMLGLIWGSNFLYMKIAAKYIDSVQIVFLRVIISVLPVFLYAAFTKSLKKEHLKYWYHYLVMSVLATVVYYYCFVKGASLLFSGIAGAISGSAPIFTFVLAAIFLEGEKSSPKKIIGLVLGLTGIILLAKPFDAAITPTTWQGVAYMVTGSLSFGASFIYAKKFITPLKIPGAALTTYQMLGASVILLLVTNFNGISNILTNVGATVGVVVGLGFLGTGLAYLIYYFIIEKFGAVKASSVAYIPPVVALLIGAALANEPIGLIDVLATGVIFAGVYLLKQK